jgi:hypothetical protein
VTEPAEDPDARIEPPAVIEADIGQVLRNLRPEQMAKVNPEDLLRLWLEAQKGEREAQRDERAAERAAERARRMESTRARIVYAILGVIVLEFVAGALLMVFADESWDELKDLLAYGVAPLAAVMGYAAGHYFPAGASGS